MSDRVLIVEGNVDLADDVREILLDAGLESTVTHDGPHALTLAAESAFDLTLVSVRLGAGGNGLALLPALRELSPHGEIIVMSGAATLHSALEAVRHGVHAYLPKPFDPGDLVRLCARALASVSLRRERTELSRELARSEALHRAVFDTVRTLVIGLDHEGRVRLWNQRAAELTGWSIEEAVGKQAATLLFSESDRDALRRLVSSAGDPGTPWRRLALQTRDDRTRTVEWQARPLTTDAEHAGVVLLMGTDRTEQIALRARAADAEAMAAMGRLTSALAHEIRNPLNAAILQAELIRRRALRGEDQETVRRSGLVTEELRRLATLLNDFLGLARPAAPVSRALDPANLAREVFALHEPSAADSGVRLELDVGSDLPAVVGDPSRLKQALTNLVVNAIDATKDGAGTAVSIRVHPNDGALVLAVEDDGPGLCEPAESVLQAFRTTKETGTGLGLPIVQRIARMHGGTVALRSRERGGTVAAIHLPVASS